MQLAEVTKRARDGFFSLKRGDDFIRRKVTRFKSLLERMERLTIKAPLIQDFRCARQDLTRALQNGFHLHSMARNAPQIVNSCLVCCPSLETVIKQQGKPQ